MTNAESVVITIKSAIARVGTRRQSSVVETTTGGGGGGGGGGVNMGKIWLRPDIFVLQKRVVQRRAQTARVLARARGFIFLVKVESELEVYLPFFDGIKVAPLVMLD